MRTVAGLFGALMLAVSATGAMAQVPDGWPPRIDVEVRERIAERWGIEPETVRLAWGVYRGETPESESAVELLGSGRGGRWAVRITARGGRTSTVRLDSGYSAIRATAEHRLERGIALGPEDVVMRDTVIWHDPAGGSPPSPVGWVTHRRIERGEILASPAVQLPLAVEAGQTVDLLWRRGSVGVRLAGIAEGSGAVGEEVFVRTESGTRLTGTVVAPGVVQLTRGESRGTPGGIS